MSFNSFILSKFSKNVDNLNNSPFIPYRILSIFYLNLLLTFFSFCFETFTCVLPFSRLLTMVCLAGSICSFFTLHNGNLKLAGTFLLLYLHVANILITVKCNAPLLGIFCPFCLLKLAYTLTDSTPIVITNTLAIYAEIIFHLTRALDSLEITLTHQQSLQIFTGMITLFIGFVYFFLSNFYENRFQSRLLKTLQANFKKSENLTKEILQVVESKDSLVSSLSHEVRNIVNLLSGSVDYLLELTKNKSSIQILKNIKMSGEILLNLVNNTLDAAKINANKLELAFDSADFEDTIKKALIINTEKLKNKNIYAEAVLDTNIPKELWIDSGRLLQIIINLLSNAIKFTPENGQIFIHAVWLEGERSPQALKTLIRDHKSSRISHSATEGTLMITEEDSASPELLEFSFEEESRHHKNLSALERCTQTNFKILKEVEQQIPPFKSWKIKKVRSSRSRTDLSRSAENPQTQGGYLKVQVSDTGCGIAEQDLPKLFGMYNQAHNQGGSMHGGTGLGLWICKQLCEKMNGEIKVYSSVNKGTDFVFYIPVKTSKAPASLQDIERPIQRKVNALVSADSQFSQNLLRLLLEREGVEVMVASDGIETFRKYQNYSEKGRVDFVFMDMDVLNIYGTSVVERIREWEQKKGLKKTEIYLISGNYFNEEEVQIPLKSGSKGGLLANLKYINKPVEVKEISNIVEEYRLKYIS